MASENITFEPDSSMQPDKVSRKDYKYQLLNNILGQPSTIDA